MKRCVFRTTALAVSCLAASPTAFAQSAPPLTATVVQPAGTILPRNTPVSLTLNETLNTKSRNTRKGSTFALSVEQGVRLGPYIVIPRGSKAMGTVLYRTGKGAFGKSGKLEVSFDYIEVGDTRVPIEGRHREEGEGNSTATVATFVFVSMLGSGLITGHSAELTAGQRFTVWTKEDMPVQLPAQDTLVAAGPPGNWAPALVAPPSTPGVLVATPLPSARRRQAVADQRSPAFGNGRVRCVTCR
jgi:hypothetical protein